MAKKILALILALVLCLSLVACNGGNNEGNGKVDGEESGTSIEENGDKNPSGEDVPEKSEGWTEADATESIVFHCSGQTHTFSKWETTSDTMLNSISYLIFDPILYKQEDGTVIPYLAEEYVLAEDNLSIYLKIREDVYFTDGRHLTGEDVWYTFETLRADAEHYPDSVASTWRKYLSSVELTGEYEVTLYFSQLMPTLINALCANTIQVVSKSAIEEMGWDEYWAAPIGTGPYKIKSADLTNSIVELELRDDEYGYWGYDYLGEYTNVKYITYAHSSEATTRIASLKTGEVDIIDSLPASEVEALRSYDTISVNLLSPTTAVMLQFACGEGDILENQKLCEAISLCIDRELIVEQLLGGFGTAAKGPVPDSSFLGYDAVAENAYEYNLEKAAELLEESSYDSRELRLVYTTSTVSIGNELTQAIQQMCAEIGIKISLEPLDTAFYDNARADHDFDIVLAAIGNTSPYSTMLNGDVIGADKFNTQYQNEELKELGTQVYTTADYDILEDILYRMYEIQLTEFQPNIYLYFPRNLYATSSNITGVQTHNGAALDLHAIVVS